MFNMSSTERAKRVAKSLRTELSARGISITHSSALETVSRMYGFRDWTDLVRRIGTAEPSPDDADVAGAERETRLETHVAVLERAGLPRDTAEAVVRLVKPTARSTKSASRRGKLGPMAERMLRFIQPHADAGNWSGVGSTAPVALGQVPASDRAPFLELLERAAAHDLPAALNHALAHVLGDAGTGLVEEGRRLLLRLVERPELSRDPNVAGTAFCILGDIASGGHGGQADPAAAEAHYRTAALVYGSPTGAFNAAMFSERRNAGRRDPNAAALYRAASDGGHAPTSTNLASMILRGEAPGTFAEAEALLRKAARLGDGKASEVLGFLPHYRQEFEMNRFVDRVAEEDGADVDRLRAARGELEAATWLAILAEHGWQFREAHPDATFEGDLIAISAGQAGLVPVHLSNASYERTTPLAEAIVSSVLERFSRKGNVFVLFGGGAQKVVEAIPRALPIGALQIDGIWTPVHLRDGGLDEAFRQRAALLLDPGLDAAEAFPSDGLAAVFDRLNDARNRRMAKAWPENRGTAAD